MSESTDTDCKYCDATFEEQVNRLQHMSDEHGDELTNLDETLIENHDDVKPPDFVSRKDLVLQTVILTVALAVSIGLLYFLFIH